MIAALYVARGGCYYGLSDVDPWDEQRDARLYDGPHAVVSHPPCSRWCRLAGLVEARWGHKRGADGGCFAAALSSVRKWGGVLEHPAYSSAWRHHGLLAPPFTGGWVRADWGGGWTCHVEQGHYGHRARKATWLYAVGCSLPSLTWGPSAKRMRLDSVYHSAEERHRMTRPPAGMDSESRAARREWLAEHAKQTGKEWLCAERMNKTERAATPLPFRDLLLDMARSVSR